jgi:hypothetical protein
MIFVNFVEDGPVDIVIPDVFEKIGELGFRHVVVSELSHGFHLGLGSVESPLDHWGQREQFRKFDNIPHAVINLTHAEIAVFVPVKLRPVYIEFLHIFRCASRRQLLMDASNYTCRLNVH